MAEVVVGLVGAAATVGAAALTTGSGFTKRHESSYRQELMETRRNMDDFLTNIRSGDVTPDEETDFLSARDEAVKREDEYHESIQSYKNTSWFNFPTKLRKRKEVRSKKRLTQQSNHSLRSLNEVKSLTSNKSIYSGSDTSSICASAGSPPGSNLAVHDIQVWADNIQSAGAIHYPHVPKLSGRNGAPGPDHLTESRFDWTVQDPSFKDSTVIGLSQIESSTGPTRFVRRQRATLLPGIPRRRFVSPYHIPQSEQRFFKPPPPLFGEDILEYYPGNPHARQGDIVRINGVEPTTISEVPATPPFPPANALNQRICRNCGLPGRYKEGKCVEKWGPGPLGPGTQCDRCRKKRSASSAVPRLSSAGSHSRHSPSRRDAEGKEDPEADFFGPCRVIIPTYLPGRWMRRRRCGVISEG
ncbi:hypothetical protein FB451DRAFT_1173298 [Mycena latifolia]|nr:hypothetical protein FB451DRAFT_1173298 [Mycena latifolia]